MTMDCEREEKVHQFLDGELALTAQPPLFAHLAACGACRTVMNVTMEFRRMSRHEVIRMPPAADEAVLARLELSKKRRSRRDRYYERRPLWQTRATLSLGVCAALAVLLFASGVKVAHEFGLVRSMQPLMEQEADPRLVGPRPRFHYVMFPGLLVEAPRPAESGDPN